jgi:hypothetical protein
MSPQVQFQLESIINTLQESIDSLKRHLINKDIKTAEDMGEIKYFLHTISIANFCAMEKIMLSITEVSELNKYKT